MNSKLHKLTVPKGRLHRRETNHKLLSIPHVPGIVFNTVLVEKRNELRLKTAGGMMLLSVVDAPNRIVDPGYPG